MEIKRYLIQKTPIGTMMKENPEGSWVEAQDFDRILAERDALQQRLNAVEEENDRLRGHALALLSGARAEMHESWKCNSYHPLLTSAVGDAEKELENRS